jgi:hypothetical protein
MFKFLKNLFGPTSVPVGPEVPPPHPLDGATRAAHAKNPLIETAPAPEPVVEKLPVVEIVPELTVQPPAEKKPRKPRAKKAETLAAVEATQWPFPGSPAAMTAAPKARKPRTKKTK